MINLDTGSVIALIAENSTVRHQLRQYIQNQEIVITQTALGELQDIVRDIAGEKEQSRAERFLEKVTVVQDNLSARAMALQPTRKLGQNDIIILGTGDSLGCITLTADSKAVRAAIAQGVYFNVYVHPPFPLTGN